ncbi:MAG: ComEC/Rec2 family competence protein [Candidatus Micropelagos thuwalensis]
MPVMLVPLAALGVGILLSVRQPDQIYRYLGLSLIIVSAGFLFAQVKTSRVDSPFLKYPITADMVALVAFYEVYGRGRLMPWPKRRIGLVEKNIRLIWLYFIALFMTSIIAGLTTGYVGIIHFNLIGNHGLLANLLAMPILGVVIMPAAMAGLIAMPFGLEQTPLMVMQWGIEKALMAANWCLTLPAPVSYIAASPKLALPLFGIALVWLCLVKSK